MNVIERTLRKAAPSRVVATAVTAGGAAAGSVFSSPVERMALQWLSVPQARLLEVQTIAALGILLLTSVILVAVLLLKLDAMKREHAEELEDLRRKKPIAASQLVATATTQSRRQILSRGIDGGRDW